MNQNPQTPEQDKTTPSPPLSPDFVLSPPNPPPHPHTEYFPLGKCIEYLFYNSKFEKYVCLPLSSPREIAGLLESVTWFHRRDYHVEDYSDTELPGSRLEDVNDETQRVIYYISKTHVARNIAPLEMVRAVMFADETLKKVTCFANTGDCQKELNKLVEEGKLKMVGVIQKNVAQRDSEHRRVKLKLEEWDRQARKMWEERAKVLRKKKNGKGEDGFGALCRDRE